VDIEFEIEVSKNIYEIKSNNVDDYNCQNLFYSQVLSRLGNQVLQGPMSSTIEIDKSSIFPKNFITLRIVNRFVSFKKENNLGRFVQP